MSTAMLAQKVKEKELEYMELTRRVGEKLGKKARKRLKKEVA